MRIGVYSHTLLHPMMSLLLSCFLFSYSPTPTLLFLFICFTFLFLSSYSCSLPLLPSYYSHVHSPTLLLPCSCFCCPIAISNPPEFVQFLLSYSPSSFSCSPAVPLSCCPVLLLSAYSPTPALLTTHSPIPTLLLLLSLLLVSYSYSPAPTLLFLRCDSYSPCPLVSSFHWITLLFLLFPNYSLTPTLPPTLLFLSFKE